MKSSHDILPDITLALSYMSPARQRALLSLMLTKLPDNAQLQSIASGLLKITPASFSSNFDERFEQNNKFDLDTEHLLQSGRILQPFLPLLITQLTAELLPSIEKRLQDDKQIINRGELPFLESEILIYSQVTQYYHDILAQEHMYHIAIPYTNLDDEILFRGIPLTQEHLSHTLRYGEWINPCDLGNTDIEIGEREGFSGQSRPLPHDNDSIIYSVEMNKVRGNNREKMKELSGNGAYPGETHAGKATTNTYALAMKYADKWGKEEGKEAYILEIIGSNVIDPRKFMYQGHPDEEIWDEILKPVIPTQHIFSYKKVTINPNTHKIESEGQRVINPYFQTSTMSKCYGCSTAEEQNAIAEKYTSKAEAKKAKGHAIIAAEEEHFSLQRQAGIELNTLYREEEIRPLALKAKDTPNAITAQEQQRLQDATNALLAYREQNAAQGKLITQLQYQEGLIPSYHHTQQEYKTWRDHSLASKQQEPPSLLASSHTFKKLPLM